MNIKTETRKQNGSTLAVVVVLCGILGILLAGYFQLVSTNYLLCSRSQKWNESLYVAEAGVEDALSFVNIYNGYFDKVTNWASTATANGWSQPNANVYYCRRYVNDDYYDVYITNKFGGTNVTIVSTGNVPWYYGTSGNNTNYIHRTVVLSAKAESLFSYALTASKTVDLKGNNINIDSFDSSNTNYSDNGGYPFSNPSKARDHGDIVANGDLINSISVGNADVKGSLHVGPNATATIGPNGSVGDKAWVDGGNNGIETGHYFNDVNLVFTDVSLPSDALWVPALKTSKKINGVTYDCIIDSNGDYTVDSFNNLYISPNIKARIKFDKSISVSGQLLVATNASLKIYMNAQTFSVGGVVNETGNPNAFNYMGLPSNTSISFGGNGQFIGTVYAPQADFTMGGGGNNVYDFIGSGVCKNATMNGHFNIHYDENLKNTQWKGYITSNWKEQ